MRDYRETYRALDEGCLLKLITELDELEPDAQRALTQELKERGISDRELCALVEAGQRRRTPLSELPGTDRELTEQIGSVTGINGFGRALYGKTGCTKNDEFGYEEWDTTLWWIFLYIPIVPRGAFRVRRKLTETRVDRPGMPSLRPGFSFVAVHRLPFRWSRNTGKLLLGVLFWLFWLLIAVAILSSLLKQGHA